MGWRFSGLTKPRSRKRNSGVRTASPRTRCPAARTSSIVTRDGVCALVTSVYCRDLSRSAQSEERRRRGGFGLVVTVGSVAIPAERFETRAETSRRRASKTDNLRQTYGFDDVSLAPGTETLDPADVDTTVDFCGFRLSVPILAAAMDAVVDPAFAGRLAGMGGIAILNLEGLQTRFEDPTAALEQIATVPTTTKSTRLWPTCTPRPSQTSS